MPTVLNTSFWAGFPPTDATFVNVAPPTAVPEALPVRFDPGPEAGVPGLGFAISKTTSRDAKSIVRRVRLRAWAEVFDSVKVPKVQLSLKPLFEPVALQVSPVMNVQFNVVPALKSAVAPRPVRFTGSKSLTPSRFTNVPVVKPMVEMADPLTMQGKMISIKSRICLNEHPSIEISPNVNGSPSPRFP